MAKNDIVLLDAIVDERLKELFPSNQRDEVFEYFSFEQILKNYDLSREEIEDGWVDGYNDGGIDGFYIFVNGHMVQDPSDFSWPKRNAEIEVKIITCKHYEGFQQAPVTNLIASIPELFDFSIDPASLKGRYSPELLSVRGNLHTAFKKLSTIRPTLNSSFYYVCRGDTGSVASNIQDRSTQLVGIVKTLFSQCNSSFHFLGSSELVELYRHTKSFSLSLPVLECIARDSGNYIALAKLSDYFEFVSDDAGELRRYLFDSNVRDFLGSNRVNDEIRNSLNDPDSPEFWWLNNGVTLLATGATAIGKVLELQDIQIVNGLQTTETIYRHFSSGSGFSKDKCILVKVIVSTHPNIRDQIIRATNNQNLVEASSLHATDKIQRDIEAVLEKNEWYYERRKNYYRNIGKPAVRFVTPMYLASGYVALCMKNPAVASRLKSRFMRTSAGYTSIFSESFPLQIWVTITEIMKRVESGLSKVRPDDVRESERFFSKWRGLVAFLVVSKLFGRFSYRINELVYFDVNYVTSELVVEIWRLIDSLRNPLATKREFRSSGFVNECCSGASKIYAIEDLHAFGRRFPLTFETGRVYSPPESLVEQVNTLLPVQPWKPGVHREIAAKMGCHHYTVSVAINELVKRGMRYRQENGIVFDSIGEILFVDEDRIGKTKEAYIAERKKDSTASVA